MKGSFSEEALRAYSELAAEKQGLDFAEGGTYDFTRCVRPDGSTYGTGGRCRKGTETAPNKSSRNEKIAKLRSSIQDKKEGGATRGQLKELRGKQQSEERLRKLERESSKTGKDPKQLAAEKAEAANRKADQALLREARKRLATAISDGNKEGEKNYRRMVERLTEKLEQSRTRIPVLTQGDMRGMSVEQLKAVKKAMDERAFGKGGAPVSNTLLQMMADQNKAINKELARRESEKK